MKKLLTVLIAISFYTSLYSQDNYFAKIMDWQDSGVYDATNTMLSLDNEDLLWSISYRTDSTNLSVGLMRTDMFGEIIWQMDLDSTTSGGTNMIVKDDQIFIAGRFSENSFDVPSNNIRLYKISTDGEILIQKYFTTNYPYEALISINQTHEGFIIAVDVKNEEEGIEDRRSILAHFDSNLELIWSREYLGIPTNDLKLIHLNQQEDGTFLVSGIEGGWMHIQSIMKIDAEGNELWRGYDNEIVRYDGGKLFQLDNNYYLTGTENEGWAYIDSVQVYGWPWPLRITKFDEQGNLLERKNLWRYGERRAYGNGFVTNDNHVIIKGYGSDLEDDISYNQLGCGWLIKLDQNLNTVWERLICDLRTINTDAFSNGVELSDGRLIFAGSSSNDLLIDDDTWLVHLDEFGCLEPNCGYMQIIDENGMYSTITSTEDISKNAGNPHTVIVSPNPVVDEFQIEFIGNQPLPERLTLSDITGRVLKEYKLSLSGQNIIQLSVPSQAAGLCFLRGYTEAGSWIKKITVKK